MEGQRGFLRARSALPRPCHQVCNTSSGHDLIPDEAGQRSVGPVPCHQEVSPLLVPQSAESL